MLIHKTALAFLSFFAAAGLWAVEVRTPVLDVPMLKSNKGHPVIEVQFPGDQRVECVVDTGASAGVASEAVLVKAGAGAEALSVLSVEGANGNVEVKRYRVSGLRIETLALPPMIFVQRDLIGLTGPSGQGGCVIGQSLLTPYAPEFDGVQQHFRLWSSDDVPDWTVRNAAQPTSFESPVAAFPVHVSAWGSDSIRWVLDTGAPMTSINHAARSAMGLDSVMPLRTVERRGLDGQPVQQPVIAIPSTEIYAGLRRQTEVEVGDLPVLAALGISSAQAGGLIGADIISGQRLLVDYRTKQVWVAVTAQN